MTEQFKPPPPSSHASILREDAVRRLSRSPHPYHRQKFELAYASELFSSAVPLNKPFRSRETTEDEGQDGQTRVSEGFRESTNSDSGTEADDEHFLKGLPAPKLRPPKGLRGGDGLLSSTSSPLLSPAILNDVFQGRLGSSVKTILSSDALEESDVRKAVDAFRHKRRIEIVRRVTESSIMGFVALILALNPEVRELAYMWKTGNSLVIHIVDRANEPRIILPTARHSIPHRCIPPSTITPHKSSKTFQSSTSLNSSSIF